MHRNRNVAIVGIGQTYHKAHRPDVNQVELVNEAVRAALGDAHLSKDDIDCVVHGNMELFEGNPPARHVARGWRRGVFEIRVPGVHRGYYRRDPGLCGGSSGGFGPFRYGFGRGFRETGGRAYHYRNHRHG